ncbi:MAG: DNA mismatch repair endonuclease MutL [Polyangiaceae bacterium]|jgi:DNA mismatch repair protein MutL
MGRISRLPSDLANQIAAGEVVERPASVVKELLENAIDAGATRITVELERGGIDLARVSDDGEGMDEADAVLAFERHATSKIHGQEDMFSLRTFGFRGEALPSIASVAKLKLATRARGTAEGTEVVIEGGGPARVSPTGVAEGTIVEMRELFFNVPARRKFLKSTGTEAAHVTDAILLAGLARPEVSFLLARDGRPARQWLRVASRRDRATQVFDGEKLESCFGERGPLRLEAHLAAPERSRAGAVALYLLVNGRPIRDRPLARAVAQAYGSVLETGRYPVGVVYIDLPTELVDVNVHPQKAEVRFADARSLFDAVMRELHGSLARAFSLPALGASRGWSPRPPPDFGQHGAPAPSSLAEQAAAADPWQLESATPPPAKPSAERTLPSPPSSTTPPLALFGGQGFYASLEFLAQVRATFLVCSGRDGLYVLDQHAAAERVTFDRLRKAFASRSVAAQKLLIPEVIELLPGEIAVLEENPEPVRDLGIELRAVGPSAVAVHAMPVLLSRSRPERVVRDVVAELGRDSRRPFGDKADMVLATMACHGSVRAGDTLSRDEAGALLRALDDTDFAGHCPHGRPVVTRIGYDELERRVGR